MRPVLLEAFAPDSPDVQLWIEVSISRTLPFVLECGYDRRGNRDYIELPRSYRTLAGAKRAAASFIGDTVTWAEPKSDEPEAG